MDCQFEIISVFIDEKLNYRGNNAAVVQLGSSMADGEMQRVASDFNQPATTFLWPGEKKGEYQVKWFAPDAEIGLCGHGAIAAIAYLAEEEGEEITLNYGNGKIPGRSCGSEMAEIKLAAIPVTDEMEIPSILSEGLGVQIVSLFATDNKHIVLLEDEQAVKNMKPNFAKLRELDMFGYSVTAKGEGVDFVSRTLVPHVQQLEDPATGSSHAALVPFWAEKLGKNKLTAHQLSPRGGKFICELVDEDVKLRGAYRTLASGILVT